jgi:hypothetical protein
MTRKKARKRWDTGVENCEVTPQEIWPIGRALLNRDALKALTAIHGYSGLKFLPREKTNAIADCLENRFTHHDLCDDHHDRRVVTLVQEILETENTIPTEKIRPRDLKKLTNSLKLKKACGIDGIPNEYQAPSKATLGPFNTSI